MDPLIIDLSKILQVIINGQPKTERMTSCYYEVHWDRPHEQLKEEDEKGKWRIYYLGDYLRWGLEVTWLVQ